ncbi:DUF1523 family protein [Candidatus Pacearchaeota archaeon]|nr:DUF1523 family protein [Candidatus Pacearchaeota archaeon]
MQSKLFVGIIVLVILGILGVLFSLGMGVAGHLNVNTVTGFVTEKERIVEGIGESVTSYYLVWIERADGSIDVLKNSDSLVRWKFDSSTIQGKIKVGEQVSVRTYGFRIPFLSMYPNIIEVK